jgi:aspartyl-tRNA(Asn)/glutamyl-tRNA(Gln) amidotransferase subunit B
MAVISQNEGVAADYRSGKQAALEFLLGKVMKELRGSADPQSAREMLKECLG